MTGDDHGNGGTVGRFQQYEADSPPGCSVADWQCVRGTSYIYPNTPDLGRTGRRLPEPGIRDRPARADQLRELGQPGAARGLLLEPARRSGGQLPEPQCPRHQPHPLHRLERLGDPAEGRAGERHSPGHQLLLLARRPGSRTARGCSPGSGMPMRFADLNGSMIDVYQAATQMTDESGQSVPGKHRLAARQRARPGGLLRRLHGEHAHRQRLERRLGRDRRLGPVARRSGRLRAADADVARRPQQLLLRWGHLEREHARLHHRSRLGRERPAGDGPDQLVGRPADGRDAQRLADSRQPPGRSRGPSTPSSTRTAGSYEATYAVDNTAPAISNVSASAPGDGTANITWDTNEASDSRVDYGTSPGSLDSASEQSGSDHLAQHPTHRLGAEHHLLLPGDLSGRRAANSATEPNPPCGRRELHHALRQLHGHDRLRLRRGHSRRQHVHLGDEQW